MKESVKEMLMDEAGRILSELLKGGGEFGEIFYEHSRTTRMELEEGKLSKITYGYEEGIGLRLIKKGRTYYGFTTEPTLKSVLEVAKTLARGEESTPVAVGKRHIRGFIPVLEDPDEKDLPFRAQILRRAEEKARSFGDRIKQVLAVLADKTREILVINSFGESAEDTQKRVVFFVEVVAGDGQILQRGYESTGGTGGYELLGGDVPERIAEKAARRALTALKAKPAPAGTFTVVMASEAGGTMIHEAVGHGLEADLVQQGLSVYAGKLGKKVASELVSVVDDATVPRANGTFNVDDEGVPARRTVLIKDGILVGYMYDRLRAMREGVESTGNGRRQSYAHIPMVRMTNTFIERGKENPEDIIKDTKKGVLVVKMGGGEVNTVTGDFVFEVMEGYLIEGGEVTYPIRGAVLMGNGPKALTQVDAVGNDLGWSIGTCGKEGQGVPVGDAQPTIRIRSLTLGGVET